MNILLTFNVPAVINSTNNFKDQMILNKVNVAVSKYGPYDCRKTALWR